jgi:hypothetical protein
MLIDALLEEGLASSVLRAPDKELFFAIRADEADGDGSAENSFRANTADDLDPRLFAQPPNVLIRFGPGLFRTRGNKAWRVKNSQKIVGAGMFNTTLRLLILPAIDEPSATAIGSLTGTLVEGFSVSDLTIDCDLEKHQSGGQSDICPKGQEFYEVFPD